MKLIQINNNVWVNPSYIVSIDTYDLWPNNEDKCRVFMAHFKDPGMKCYKSPYSPEQIIALAK